MKERIRRLIERFAWFVVGPKLDKFIQANARVILEEVPNLDYIQFRFRKKEYRFDKVSQPTN